MRHRGKMFWCRKHIDAHFAEQRPDPNVAEWISAEELTSFFDVPKQTIYDLAYENQIIKRKQGCISFYDKQAMLQALERRRFGDEAKEPSVLIQKAKPTIYALVRKGLLPACKLGKKLYFYE